MGGGEQQTMRILVWPSSYPPHIGGVEKICSGLVESLHDRGHTVTVITESYTSTANVDLGSSTVHRMPFHHALRSRNPRLVAELTKQVLDVESESQPDVINLHAIHPSQFFFLRTRTEASPPMIFSSHGWSDHRLDPQSLGGRVLRAADRIVGCSRFATSRAKQLIPDLDKRMITILNGLQATSRPPTQLPDGSPQIVGIGRLEPHKGFDVLLGALPEVFARSCEAEVTIVGDGSERDRLRSLTEEYGLDDRVQIVGPVPAESVTQWIDTARVVVVPTLYAEGFGLVAAEAGQRGRPVVASRTGGLPEIVEDGMSGYLVEPGNVHGLAHALIRLVSDLELARRLGSAGQAVVQDRLSWKRYVDEYEILYQDVVGAAV